MAAREKKKKGTPKAMWLVTFSDLMTLLLTFFVLLLSMSSMDQSFITNVTVYSAELGFLTHRGAGRISAKVRMISEMMDRPWEVMEKRNRIKDLLFPDEEMPPDINRAALDDNLHILAKPDGVALVFTDKLLFPLGEYVLDDSAKKLLMMIVPLIKATIAPINIAGYTDSTGGTGDNFELAGERALAVLEFLVSQGVAEQRFSVSSYGPFFPMADNDTPKGQAMNRRVEILLKTTKPVGSYS